MLQCKHSTMLDDEPKGLLAKLGINVFLAVVRDCVACEDVRVEVEANYAENRWWPTWIADWRLRMLIAGWSTRVSYNHIAHYQAVVVAVEELGWKQLVELEDGAILKIVGALGLGSSRIRYLRSLTAFVAGSDDGTRFLQRSNDDLIAEFASKVDGAGYKVAQCAVLYAKGYHCGIIPIDSGMAEMLAPLVPQRLPTGAVRHEIIRRWLEEITKMCSGELHEIAREAGVTLGIARQSPTWWVHLLLIYYKRLYWNRRRLVGPFRRSPIDTSIPDPVSPNGVTLDTGSFPGIVLEGVDGTGKSTASELLTIHGYKSAHAPYSEEGGIFERYQRQIGSIRLPTVLDRCFVSEYVYGRVRRGYTRLTLDECLTLLAMLAARGFVVVHLEEGGDLLAQRRTEFESDLDEIRRLRDEYRTFFDAARRVIPVFPLQLSQLAPGYLLRYFEYQGSKQKPRH